MRPFSIPEYITECWEANNNSQEIKDIILNKYALLTGENPEVSIVIPAYNEEHTILGTLYSLCNNVTSRSVEIVVVNNNSKDQTEEIIRSLGVNCVNEYVQGITVARNAGLAAAKGKYILNADADSIYPKDWIEEMIKPLDTNNSIALSYGRFSFIPTGSTTRTTFFFYEYLAEFTRFLNKYIKDEAVNVYGFNSGFRKDQGLSVEGFNHPPGTNEDGWLALKLRNKGFGTLYCVTDIKALVWTTDRRIQLDGGLWKGVQKRLNRVLRLKA